MMMFKKISVVVVILLIGTIWGTSSVLKNQKYLEMSDFATQGEYVHYEQCRMGAILGIPKTTHKNKNQILPLCRSNAGNVQERAKFFNSETFRKNYAYYYEDVDQMIKALDLSPAYYTIFNKCLRVSRGTHGGHGCGIGRAVGPDAVVHTQQYYRRPCIRGCYEEALKQTRTPKK